MGRNRLQRVVVCVLERARHGGTGVHDNVSLRFKNSDYCLVKVIYTHYVVF